MPIIEIKTNLEDIVRLAHESTRLVYAFRTCWWKLGAPVYQHPKNGLPCGPRGEMLMEMDEPMRFIQGAIKNSKHYGRHGLLALVAAYYGNTVTEKGLPTSLASWDEYNDLLDQSTTLSHDLKQIDGFLKQIDEFLKFLSGRNHKRPAK